MDDHHFQRALVLYGQERYDLAEKELRQSLAAEPADPIAHALLARCLTNREEYAEATAEAKVAIQLAPDYADGHFALATVLYHQDRLAQAEDAIAEAIRLRPEDAAYYLLRGLICHNAGDWNGVLEWTERGLNAEPTHAGCTNLRAMVLVKLGRTREAGMTLRAALARDPEDALTHANQGWALLETGDPNEAMEHFREALRLDPESEWARKGIVEALKARHLLYYWMLRYFLWMERLSRKARWAVILGGLLGYSVLDNLAERHAALKPFVFPIIVLYLGFVLLTWIADPLFNLLLRTDAVGRLALSRDQLAASNYVGACIAFGIGALAIYLGTGSDAALLAALGICALVVPVDHIFKVDHGLPRIVLALYALGEVLCGGLALVLYFLGSPGYIIPATAYLVGVFALPVIVGILVLIQRSR